MDCWCCCCKLQLLIVFYHYIVLFCLFIYWNCSAYLIINKNGYFTPLWAWVSSPLRAVSLLLDLFFNFSSQSFGRTDGCGIEFRLSLGSSTWKASSSIRYNSKAKVEGEKAEFFDDFKAVSTSVQIGWPIVVVILVKVKVDVSSHWTGMDKRFKYDDSSAAAAYQKVRSL